MPDDILRTVARKSSRTNHQMFGPRLSGSVGREISNSELSPSPDESRLELDIADVVAFLADQGRWIKRPGHLRDMTATSDRPVLPGIAGSTPSRRPTEHRFYSSRSL